MTDILGVAANLCTCIAAILFARKIWWAPIWGIGTQVIWVMYAVGIPAWPLLISGIFMLVVYTTAVSRWRKER